MSQLELKGINFGHDRKALAVDDNSGIPIMELPEKENEYIRALLEAQNIEAYKDALKSYYGENYQVPEGNVKVVSLRGMGTKIFVGNEVVTFNEEMPVEAVLEIETRAQSIKDVKEMVNKALGKEISKDADISSLENREEEQRGDSEELLTRAQRASIER